MAIQLIANVGVIMVQTHGNREKGMLNGMARNWETSPARYAHPVPGRPLLDSRDLRQRLPDNWWRTVRAGSPTTIPGVSPGGRQDAAKSALKRETPRGWRC